MSDPINERPQTFCLVVVESPYAGATDEEIARNVKYARAAMRDCLMKNEAPYASHLLYTQPGVLRDDNKEERKLGITAGFAWRRAASMTVVYIDHGITKGMRLGIEHAEAMGCPVEYRSLEKLLFDEDTIVDANTIRDKPGNKP